MCPPGSRPGGIRCHLLTVTFLLSLLVSLARLMALDSEEGLSPPEGITVHCQLFHCYLWWEQPPTRASVNPKDLKYQLDIQKQERSVSDSENPLIEVPGSRDTVYTFASPRPIVPHTVRIRAQNLQDGLWGAWSQPIEFGLPFSPDVDPGLHVTFNPRTRVLSWDCREDATNIRCLMSYEGRLTVALPKNRECWCRFDTVPLHGGVTLEVLANMNHQAVREQVVYPNPGLEGSGARNLSCFVYNAASMNCTWEKGPAAPSDVQYYLYIVDIDHDTECPQYMPEWGTHTGCHFPRLGRSQQRKYLLLNGTSQDAQIQFFDAVLMLKDVERLNPPRHLDVTCDGSTCTAEWEQPASLASLFYFDFKYQLDIQGKGNTGAQSENSLVTVPGNLKNAYTFPSPQPPGWYTLRVRAANSLALQWGAWSEAVEFVSSEGVPEERTPMKGFSSEEGEIPLLDYP